MKLVIPVLVAAAFAGCAEHNFVYTPETANAVSHGMPASRTAIPQEMPQGAVEVTSQGIGQLRQGDGQLAVLHVRMIVTNDGDATPWLVDTRQQAIDIAGEGRATPIYANADVQTLPQLQVARGERRVIDLYYPLPGSVTSAARLPHFDVLWQVTTGARVVASRTAFDRVRTQQPDDYAYETGWPLWAGYGPYWWWDPFYPSVVFVHGHGGPIRIHDHRGRVSVGHFNGHFRASRHVVAHR
jgi:hypothetical protein